MAGKNGGVRPGAGRKKQSTLDDQSSRRDIVLEVFSPEEWRQTVVGWMQTARETKNYGLLFPLLPYLMGSPKQEVKVEGQIEHRLTIETIRQAIGITEIKALPDPQRRAS